MPPMKPHVPRSLPLPICNPVRPRPRPPPHVTGPRVWLLVVVALTAGVSADPAMASRPALDRDATHWVGTWAAAAQPNQPANLQTFANQSLRLVVDVSVGGT